MHNSVKVSKYQSVNNNVYAVILIGGKGKRLRPLSTNSIPKAFLSITKDNKTMFRKTVDRIRKIIPAKNILVVANKAHARLTRRDFPNIDKSNLLLEPISRNTASAIYFAARTLKERFEDAIMAVLPTDQYIIDEGKYLSSIRSGIDFVSDNEDSLLVLAVKPTYPAMGLGYVKIPALSNLLDLRGQGGNIYKVEKFVEKPNLNTAIKFIESGRYLWNAGAFIFRVSAILNAIKRFVPKIFDGLKDLNKINEDYKKLPNISIDYAVMEKAHNIYCVKGSYRWRDMGTFESLKYILKRESRDFIVRDGKTIKVL